MASTVPFTPTTAGTVTITVTASSVNTALTFGSRNQQVYIQSLVGNAICFVELGTAAASAAIATGFPILPGQRYCLTAPGGTAGGGSIGIAVIGTSGTLYVSTGNGIPA